MADKKKKPQRLKARLPRGFVDRDASDIRAQRAMTRAIEEVFECYGFDPIETPAMEYTDALGKFLPDADRPNEGVFSLTDDDDQWMSLRYDLTAPLARHVAQNFNDIQLPYRTYRAGYVFRNEKPGPGRFRQFMQMDADTVGAPGVQADAEMCMMMADIMEALGIKRGDYVVRVNNRKVLDGVMEAIGVSDEGQKLGVLRAIDKLDRVGIGGVRQLLGEGRKDESGDFTVGVGLDATQIERLQRFLMTSKSSTESSQEKPEDDRGDWLGIDSGDGEYHYHKISNELTISRFEEELSDAPTALEGFAELRVAARLCDEAGYGNARIMVDPSVVRGLEYYTGPVYECELTFPVTNEKGEEVVFGSVAGGGRYDGLVARFRGNPVPATGFSIGVSRLMTALKNLGRLQGAQTSAPVLVTVMDGEAMGRYQGFVQQLRQANIRAEMYQGNWKKFGNQLKYADRRGCPLAIIQGSDERDKGEVQIKDLIEGRRQAQAIESNEEWRAERPGQVAVAEDDLVETVKRILAEQAQAKSG